GGKMLTNERTKQLRALNSTKETVRVNELSEQYNVSEMTIYRDMKPLLEEGMISSTTAETSPTKESEQPTQNQNNCIYCHKPNQSKVSYRLIVSNDNIETACCAHCGLLRHRQKSEEVSHAIWHDFFMNTTISASLTWYVMDTT